MEFENFVPSKLEYGVWFTKIETEIGWKPKKSVETIFKDIYLWIQKNEKQLESILK